MNSDFRLHVDFADHPKIEKAVRTLGDSVFRCIVRLFGWVTKNRPSGVLTNLDAEDVAINARWPGDAAQFCQTLSDLRIIDRSDDGKWFVIHDWRDYNAWAAEESGRSAHAKRLNHERWHVQKGRREESCSLCNTSDESDTESHLTQSGIPSDSVKESSLRLSSEEGKEEEGARKLTAQQEKVRAILNLFPSDYAHPLPEPAIVAKWIKDVGFDEAKAIVADKAAGQFNPGYIATCIATRVGQMRNGAAVSIGGKAAQPGRFKSKEADHDRIQKHCGTR